MNGKTRKFFSFILLLSLLLVSCGGENNGSNLESSEESLILESENNSLAESENNSLAESEDNIENSESEENASFDVDGEYDDMEEKKIVDPFEVGFEKITNPFASMAADPFITYHNGKYYYIYVSGNSILISSFNTLAEVTKIGAKRVFVPPSNTEYSSDVWAPELHFIDGYWYIYFAACDGNNKNHRMFVLKSKTDDALGEYEFLGKITDSSDRWAIDGTVFKYQGKMYFVWSGWQGNKNVSQRIYIAEMSSPTEISGTRYCISSPEYEWETQGGRPEVNEGPAVIVNGDYLAIIYSASGSWCDDYCLGQLTFKGGDIRASKNWVKNPTPILQKDENRFYGPGHCSIARDENGVYWIVFHANLESGTGWNGRSGWMYPIRIDENGLVQVVFY